MISCLCMVDETRKRKWVWAGHVARKEDGRWSTAVLGWKPHGTRKFGRPLTRWKQDIRGFVEAAVEIDPCAWMLLAQDRNIWSDLGHFWGTLEEEWCYQVLLSYTFPEHHLRNGVPELAYLPGASHSSHFGP